MCSSDLFSTAENNQTLVEVHVLQGEREMAVDNKSLGRFKLTGIPPAPRGVPQVQVAFDIDANGILQVTARDKTTGREQTITVQGASTLSELEVNRMIREAAEFAEKDRERRERVEKRNRAKALTDQAQRRLKEVTLDFGSQFVSSYRRQMESLSSEILASLEQEDDRRLDRAQADLQDVLYELNREVRLQYEEEEGGGFFESIRRTFTGDNEEDYSYSSRGGTQERWGDMGTRGQMPMGGSRERGYSGDRYGSYDRYDRYESYQPDNQMGREPRRSSANSLDGTSYRSNADDSRYSPRGRSRPIPPENNWDEEDDDWF